jgi:coenzyme PQQ precursor peptide PqqA
MNPTHPSETTEFAPKTLERSCLDETSEATIGWVPPRFEEIRLGFEVSMYAMTR